MLGSASISLFFRWLPLVSTIRPFVKWAGGKAQMLDELVTRSPSIEDGPIASYFEPFLGGAALFFALLDDPDRIPRRSVLNDLNSELMVTFSTVRDDLDRLVDRLDTLQKKYLTSDDDARADFYYQVRKKQPRAPIEVSARLIFLNKTCYNGLYRVNRQGRFNVPHGRYKNPRILDRQVLLAASRALQGAELLCVDFEEACESSREGDFAYFDPPFYPLTETSKFTSYTEADFGRQDQLRLKWCIDRLTDRGVHVMVSNSSHDFVRGMYEGSCYRVEELAARRMINSRGDRRVGSSELLITNYDFPGSNAK